MEKNSVRGSKMVIKSMPLNLNEDIPLRSRKAEP